MASTKKTKYVVHGARGAKYECDTLAEAKKVAGKTGRIQKKGAARKRNPAGESMDYDELEELVMDNVSRFSEGYYDGIYDDANHADVSGWEGASDDFGIDSDMLRKWSDEAAEEFAEGFLEYAKEAYNNGTAKIPAPRRGGIYTYEDFVAAAEALEVEPFRAGTDLYLTQAGHGAGFWDGRWGNQGNLLTAITKMMGSPEEYYEALLFYPDEDE